MRAAPVGDPDAEERAASCRELRGVVVDARTGAPLAEVRVAAGAHESATGRDGAYAIAVESDSVASVIARAPGYVPAEAPCARDDVSPSGRVRTIALHAVAARRIARVVDASGVPVAGAKVRVDPAPDARTSAADGTIGEIELPARGEIAWRAWGAGLAARAGVWRSDDASWPAELLVQLPAVDPVLGTVVDADGRPVAGVAVRALRGVAASEARTDAHGRFTWPAAAGGCVLLGAASGTSRGFTWAAAGLPARIALLPDGRFPEPSTALPPPGAEGPARLARVSGRTVDESGRVVVGAALTFVGATSRAAVREYSDGDGRWAVDVAVGPVLVHVFAAGYEQLQLDLPDVAQLPRELVLRARAAPAASTGDDATVGEAMITGRVVDAAGRPVADARVNTQSAGTTTDADGTFRLAGGEHGRTVGFGVCVEHYPDSSGSAVAGGASVVVRLPARGVVEVLLDGCDEIRPEEKPEFLLTAAGAEDALLSSRVDDCLSVDLGDRVRVAVPEGVWTLAFARAPGDWVRFADLRIAAGEVTRLRYAFPRFGALEGRVRAADGTPVAGAEVFLEATGALLAVTGEDGVFRCARVRRGPEVPVLAERLLVIPRAHAPTVTAPVELTGRAFVELVVDRGRSVRGVLVDDDGRPCAGRIAWLPPSGPAQLEVHAGDDGNFAFETPLACGIARLRVVRGDAVRDVDVEIPAGDGPCEIRVRAPARSR